MRRILLLLLTACSFTAFGQGEANWWFFGFNAGVNFNNGIEMPTDVGSLSTFEGCASISSDCGDLLFYTDGSTIWNANHVPMPGANGNLLGSSSAAQSGIIVPDLQIDNQYYVFTVDDFGGPNGVRYTVVDMTLNGNMGGVVPGRVNQVVRGAAHEKISAVLHADEESYWVMTYNDNQYQAFRVFNNTVSTTPVTSNINNFLLDDPRGTLKFNINGTRLANTSVGNGATIADFDNATGIVTNEIRLGGGSGVASSPYGVEFSPSGELLYVDMNSSSGGNGCPTNATREILQYDLLLPNFQLSPVAIFSSGNETSRGALQLGIDNKIYAARACQPWLGVIRKPDTRGTGATYRNDGFALSPGTESREGLPPFITSFFGVDFDANDAASGTGGGSTTTANTIEFCNGQLIEFTYSTAAGAPSCATFQWDFDDGTSSTTETTQKNYPTPGTYEVTLSVSISRRTQRTSITVIIYEEATANPVNDIDICDTDMDGFENIDFSGSPESEIRLGQSTTDFEVSFHSSLADAQADTNAYAAIEPFNSTGMPVEVFARIDNKLNNNSLGCEEITSFFITVSPPAVAQRPTDLTLCDDDTDGFQTFDLTQTEPEVTGGAGGVVTYYTSQADATAGINEITNPVSFTTTSPSSERVFIRLGGTTTGACAPTFTEVDLFTIPNPTANVVLDKPLCDLDGSGDDELDIAAITAEVMGSQTNPDFIVSFYDSQAEADAGTPQAAQPILVTNTRTIFVRIENQTSPECYDTTSFTAELTGVPVANPVAEYRLCDDDSNNGSESFDLPSRDPQVLDTQNPAGLNIDYFISQADADLGVDGGATPLADNYSSGGQIIYVRVENTQNTDCYDTTSFELIIDTQPLTVSLPDVPVCDEFNDGSQDVLLDNYINDVLNGQAISNPEVTFYLSQADADAGTNAQGSTFPAPLGTTTIYSRLENLDNTECFAVSQFDIILSPQAEANPLTEIRVCDDASNDGVDDFNLPDVNTELLGSQDSSLFNIEYFSSMADADDGTLNGAPALPSLFNTGTTTVFVRIETAANRTCYDVEPVDLFVDELPRIGTVDDLTVCDEDNDGIESRDLSDFDVQVLDGQSDAQFEVSYYETDGDAQAGTNPLPNPFPIDSTTPSIFARVDNVDNDTCPAITSFDFTISPTPIANNAVNLVECDNPTNPGVFMFDLGMNDSEILGTQDPNAFTINYYASDSDRDMAINALPRMYLSSAISAPETIYARLDSNLTSICPAEIEFTLKIDSTPTASMPGILTLCDDKEDMIEQFNLESQTVDILNGQDPSVYEVTYHLTDSDAMNDINPLSSPYTNNTQAQTIYVRVDNRNNDTCADFTLFDIEVYDRPDIQDQAPPVICAGVPETLDAGNGFTTYLWSTGEDTQTIDVVAGGDYTVTVTNDLGCDNTAVYRVRESDVAVFDKIVIGDFEVNTNEITVLVTGSGDYEYSIDGFNYQSSNVFDNLYPGFYTVYVNDRNGCGQIQEDVTVLGGPQFFTPNTDGYNDTWQIVGANLIPDAQVFIYDRQGRLLKQMSPTGPGWDGTFNGNPLPSSDYWYSIEMANGRRVTGHFAMKR